MRGFWKTLAKMGEDANSFNQELGKVAQCVTIPDFIQPLLFTNLPHEQRGLDLQQQPTPAILGAVDVFLRSRGLVLFAYELAEVNRIVCETKLESPPHKNLKEYWAALGPIAPANRESVPFMEAIGALAVDGWARFNFASHSIDMSHWFGAFPNEEDLRTAVQTGKPADLAAKRYFAAGWGGHSCGSVMISSPDWVAFNA